jgi:hypothetical protein
MNFKILKLKHRQPGFAKKEKALSESFVEGFSMGGKRRGDLRLFLRSVGWFARWPVCRLNGSPIQSVI